VFFFSLFDLGWILNDIFFINSNDNWISFSCETNEQHRISNEQEEKNKHTRKRQDNIFSTTMCTFAFLR